MPAGVGALIEEPRFYPWLTARENLRVVATGRPDRLAQIADVLEAAGLGERADEKVKRFSQGMRQRLGIARALLGSPSLVILDEPTNGLDPAGFRWIRSLIGDLRERAVTVVIASHVLSEVQIMCTDVAILADGKGVVAGPTDAVLSGKHSLEDVFFAATEET
jgi:ABC-2 type transport system ATP-binding protein